MPAGNGAKLQRPTLAKMAQEYGGASLERVFFHPCSRETPAAFMLLLDCFRYVFLFQFVGVGALESLLGVTPADQALASGSLTDR